MKRKTKVVVAATAACVVLAVLLSPTVIDSIQRTRALQTVADNIQVPGSWELTIDEVTFPQPACIGKPCPSVFLRWQTPGQMTVENFRSLLEHSGLDLTVEGGCAREDEGGGPETICKASGLADTVQVDMYATNDSNSTVANTFTAVVTER